MASIGLPKVVSRAEWVATRNRLLAGEKELTRAVDALPAERRRLPTVKIEKDYSFEGPHGRVRLPGLFEARQQLIIYHFMFSSGGEACAGCSSFSDNIGRRSCRLRSLLSLA